MAHRLNIIVHIILSIVFLSYEMMTTCFTHTHIINGVIIVHSHPYNKNHPFKHTKNQAYTFRALGHHVVTEAPPIINIPEEKWQIIGITLIPHIESFFSKTICDFLLRAPPPYYSIIA
ncbi:MAG: hypothetical protein WCR45_06855 [Bacteroidaceae bacterium]